VGCCVGETVTGEAVVGAFVTGEAVVGEAVVGEAVVGAFVTGEAVVGEAVVGEAVAGEAVFGEAVVGAFVTGEVVVGEAVVGEAVVGEAVVGEAVLGEVVVGEVVVGEVVVGDVVEGAAVCGKPSGMVQLTSNATTVASFNTEFRFARNEASFAWSAYMHSALLTCSVMVSKTITSVIACRCRCLSCVLVDNDVCCILDWTDAAIRFGEHSCFWTEASAERKPVLRRPSALFTVPPEKLT